MKKKKLNSWKERVKCWRLPLDFPHRNMFDGLYGQGSYVHILQTIVFPVTNTIFEHYF